MASASLYILYAGLTNTLNSTLLILIILLATETTVLLFNKWTCPLTPLAEKYTKNRSHNFDIYLPNWLAKYNKIIFGTIFVIGIILTAMNLIKKI
ncbi:hypothetical protein J4226_00030 [Candidatus Pacearchaeota archaeon]|nr:hypothetical protein [Candidatus Pacearchaeota archaeon]